MKLCMALMSLSAAATNAPMASDDTPWASGELRGNGVTTGLSARAAQCEDKAKIATHASPDLMFIRPFYSARQPNGKEGNTEH